MRMVTMLGAAALALAACGTQESGNEADAADVLPADSNLIEPAPAAGGGNAAGTSAPVPAATPTAAAPQQPQTVEPAAKQTAPRAEPRRRPEPNAPPTKAQTEPDPHAGHDMANMSHD